MIYNILFEWIWRLANSDREGSILSKNQFWENSIIVTVVSLFVDWQIAREFTESDSDFWVVFCILLLAPLLFAVKFGVVRYFVWRVFARDEVVDNLICEFRESNWPKPIIKFSDGTDYLLEVAADENAEVSVRIKAAQLYGAFDALVQSQQIVASLQTGSALTYAVREYSKSTDGDGL